jgi:hypothetical protein
LRLIAVALLIANIGMGVYIALTPSPETATAARIARLQINPARIKIMDAASRGPQGSNLPPKRNEDIARTCLEWSPLEAPDVTKALAALGGIGLAERSIQRGAGEAAAGVQRYALYIREPDANAVVQIAEIQRDFAGTAIRAAACP